MDDVEREIVEFGGGNHPFTQVWFALCIVAACAGMGLVAVAVLVSPWWVFAALASFGAGFGCLGAMINCIRLEDEFRDVQDPHGGN